jgi:hypothetical protein
MAASEYNIKINNFKTPPFLFVPFILLTLFLTSCSLLDKADTSRRKNNLETKEVPFQARVGDDLRKRIVVLPFLDTEIQRPQAVTDLARRVVVEELTNTRQFVVVNTSDIPQDVSSFVRENKEYDMVALSRIASNLGIAAVVEGKILDIRAKRMGDSIGLFRKIKAMVEVDVQIRVYGAKSGKEIYNVVRRAKVEDEITRVGESVASDQSLREDPTLVRAGVKAAVEQTVGGIVKATEKLSWEGRIALVRGDRIYVNAGRVSGLQVGDILKISEDGEEVFDPETGSFLGLAPGRMKGTVELINYYGTDGAVGIVHSGSGFKENDRVELY